MISWPLCRKEIQIVFNTICNSVTEQMVPLKHGRAGLHLLKGEEEMLPGSLQCLAGYYHINDGHLLDTKNK